MRYSIAELHYFIIIVIIFTFILPFPFTLRAPTREHRPHATPCGVSSLGACAWRASYRADAFALAQISASFSLTFRLSVCLFVCLSR